VVKESSRVVRVHVRIQQAGDECFDGTLTFALLDRAGAERLLKAPLPESWAKYAR
jgi:hypothetical protein